MKRKDASELIRELIKNYSYEDIASRLGRSFNTVYGWRNGIKCPSIGDYKMMEEMLPKAENNA